MKCCLCSILTVCLLLIVTGCHSDPTTPVGSNNTPTVVELTENISLFGELIEHFIREDILRIECISPGLDTYTLSVTLYSSTNICRRALIFTAKMAFTTVPTHSNILLVIPEIITPTDVWHGYSSSVKRLLWQPRACAECHRLLLIPIVYGTRFPKPPGAGMGYYQYGRDLCASAMAIRGWNPLRMAC